MMKRRSRTVRPDQLITMSEPFSPPVGDVELRLPSGAVVVVAADALNQEFARQQAAYASEAYIDARGVLRGPSGVRRRTNRIRLLDVADLVADPGVGGRAAV